MEVIAGPAWQRPMASPSQRAPAHRLRAELWRRAGRSLHSQTSIDETDRRGCGRSASTSRLISPFDLADPLDSIWPVISQTGVAWLLSQHPDWENKVAPAIAEMATAGAELTARGLSECARYDRGDEAGIRNPVRALRFPDHANHGGDAVAGHANHIPPSSTASRSVRAAMRCSRRSRMRSGLPAISLPCVVDDGALAGRPANRRGAGSGLGLAGIRARI